MVILALILVCITLHVVGLWLAWDHYTDDVEPDGFYENRGHRG